MNNFVLRSTMLAAATLFATAPWLPAQQPNPIPQHFKSIYPSSTQAQAQVHEAMQLAAQQHKRVLLVFGTDQCADCQAYEILLDSPHNHDQIAEHFLLVHIDVGSKHTQNLTIGRRFGIDVQQGIPAVSVIDGQGHVIHAQTINHAHNMGDADVTAFLNRWRG